MAQQRAPCKTGPALKAADVIANTGGLTASRPRGARGAVTTQCDVGRRTDRDLGEHSGHVDKAWPYLISNDDP